MRVLLVIGSQINGFPPVRNLLEILLRNGHSVTLMARDKTGLVLKTNENYRFIKIPEFEGVPSMLGYVKKIRFMRENVVKEMENHDILWTATDATVRDLGDVVLRYRHVMQLMELIRDIPKFPGQSMIGLDIKRYAQQAFKVVVPEYNRAHIQKTWWSLKALPTVLPNKMTVPDFDGLEIPDEVSAFLKQADAEQRKIILYQGVFYEDRDLEHFAEAASALKDEYVLYLMGAETDYKKRLCAMGPEIVNVPFMKPPFHLLVTQRAYIGLLPYKASNYLHYDTINALYCAPNKIYEYAAYGVPMIGTDVPGLHGPFSEYGIGYTCQPYTVETVIENIRRVSEHHSEMREKCKTFYAQINMDEIVNSILCEEP